MNTRIGRWCVVMAAVVGGCGPSAPPQSEPVATGGGTVVPARVSLAPAARSDADPSSPSGEPAYLIDEHAQDRVVARVAAGQGPGQRTITMSQLLKPLVESHGLNTLLLLVQLELAKQAAEDAKIVLGPSDLKAERAAIIDRLAREADKANDAQIEAAQRANRPDLVARYEKKKQADRDGVLKNYLEQQRVSPAELELILETNSYMRKVAEPAVRGQITEDMLRKEFGRVYSEKVRVRHIQLDRPQDAGEVTRRLAAGESFNKVARDLSKNPNSKVLDGELPPFTREDTRVPKSFREAVFTLKVGEVSNLIDADGTFHLVKLEERIMPKGVKFEDLRDSLTRDLTERVMDGVMGQIREKFGEIARKTLKIDDPVLAGQFREKIEAMSRQQVDRDQVLLDFEQKRRAATQPGAAAQPGATVTQPALPNPAAAQPPAGPTSGAAPAFGTAPAAPAPPPPAAATRPAGATTRPAGVPN